MFGNDHDGVTIARCWRRNRKGIGDWQISLRFASYVGQEGRCGLRPLRAVGSTSRKPACKPVPISLRAGLRLVEARSYASERSGPGGKVDLGIWKAEWGIGNVECGMKRGLGEGGMRKKG